MSSSRTKMLSELALLNKERRQLLNKLIRQDELAVGSVSVVRRACGNPTCHCRISEKKHPQTLFLFVDKTGVRRCKLVRRADEKRVQKAGQRYRDFKRCLRRLCAIESRIKAIVMALMEARALHYK